MQVIVYTFVVLAALGVGATAYFGLAFSPVEAGLAAFVFAGLGILSIERTLRRRAEARLEKAIEDLSRLLATDAQAGAVLSQRVNQLADQDAGKRLQVVEADISVLGTVIRQVAEAVAEIEEQRTPSASRPAPREAAPAPEEIEPTIPPDAVRRALADDRLAVHVQPVLTLPQRRVHGYDLVPRLMLDGGEVAEPQDFLPRNGGEDIRRQVDGASLLEAIAIARRARSAGQTVVLFVPLSRATLADRMSREQHLSSLEANRTIAQSVVFLLADTDWQALNEAERIGAGQLVRVGATFALGAVRSLRSDIAALVGQGVRALRVDAGTFLSDPQALTDFHISDVASYLARFGVDLVVTGVGAEEQILELIEDGVDLAQGPHLARPEPARSDLASERPRAIGQLRRAEG
ncbi:EAL domain-containing protein [Devosia nitrariae]|uniref:EAL domain-containing protein n=1 Tax=Devosia nitrariae TaxID=2071872 RepID=UPI0024E110F6|nr:EAL domain-containing protein [Devosia nitrariae]